MVHRKTSEEGEVKQQGAIKKMATTHVKKEVSSAVSICLTNKTIQEYLQHVCETMHRTKTGQIPT